MNPGEAGIDWKQFWDHTPEGMAMVDASGRIRSANPAFEQLSGYGKEVLCSLMLDHLLERGDWLAAFEKGDRWRDGHARLRVKNGSTIPVIVSLTPLRKQGSLQGALLWVSDHSACQAQMESLKILCSAVEQSPNAVMITDLDGKIVYVNPNFTRLTGYTAEELIGKNPSILKSGKTSPETYRRLRETIRQGGEWREVIQDKRKDGRLYWTLETISPIRDANGRVTHYLAIQKDITEQKKAEEALRESEARFRQIADMTGEWIWEQDPQGHYIYSSSAVKKILGYEPEEILGRHYLELFTPQDRKRWESKSAQSVPFRHRFKKIINRYRHKNGHEVYTESTGLPIFDEQGKLLKWRGVDHDITLRKRYEDQLRVRDRAIEAASVGIDIADATRSAWPAIYVNPALCEMTGFPRQKLIGRNVLELVCDPECASSVLKRLQAVVSQGGEAREVLQCFNRAGEPFWDEVTISPVKDEEGRIVHVIEIHNDITERRQAEAERHALEIARHIQQSLLPARPLKIHGVEVAGACIPATQVGGDYFDYFTTPNGLDIVIADVSGHSVGAAIIMAEARSILKVEVCGPVFLGVAELLTVMNDVLYEDLDRAELFITLFYVRYDIETGCLSYANAGHNRPLLIREKADGCTQLDAEGLILGVRKGVVFEEKSVSLAPGDRLLLYTDGIVEARNPAGRFYGLSRLCEQFTKLRGESPQDVVEALLKDVRRFCESSVFDDDISLVVLQVQERGGKGPDSGLDLKITQNNRGETHGQGDFTRNGNEM